MYKICSERRDRAMKYVIGALIGLAWGSLLAWVNSLINRAAIRTNSTRSMLLASFGRTLIDLAGLAAVFFLRNAHPFSFEAMIVGTAAALGLLTVVFAYMLSRPDKAHRTQPEDSKKADNSDE